MVLHLVAYWINTQLIQAHVKSSNCLPNSVVDEDGLVAVQMLQITSTNMVSFQEQTSYLTKAADVAVELNAGFQPRETVGEAGYEERGWPNENW